MSDADAFDLAFSFAGEDREYVEAVKNACVKLGLSVYYDKDRKIDQWGKSFIGEQRKVYSGYKTKHFVPFISEHYFAKPIPTDEFRSALMESTKRSQYILPVKLDSSKVSAEYLHADTQYLKSSDYTPDQLAGALKYAVGRGKETAKDVDQLLTDELDLPAPKVVPRSYSKFEAAESLLDYIPEKFNEHLPKLRQEGYAPVVRKKDESVYIMVERDGKTLFVVNIFFGNMGENVLGYNFDSQRFGGSSQSYNGTIEPVFDKQSQQSGYLLTDYSNSGDKSLKTKEEIVEFFWGTMNQRLEAKA
jgi:hypothetical protein